MHHRIGVDLRPLQIGHQFRGIGEHISRLIKNFPSAEGFDRCRFTFYAYEGLNDPTEGIKAGLRNYPHYELVDVGQPPPQPERGLVSLTSRDRDDHTRAVENALIDAEVDDLLAFDIQLGVPETAPFRTTLIMYDLIPYLFPDQYYQRLPTAIRSRADLRASIANHRGLTSYRHWLRRSTANADQILTISDHTRADLEAHLGLDPAKLQTVLLGAEPAAESVEDSKLVIDGIDRNYDAVGFKPAESRYMFYIGGSDFRRQLSHLVDSFELARRELPDLKLVLAGADFASIDGVHHTQDPAFIEGVKASSHGDDIVMLGYISERERSALYRHALAFVYPTLYEGFGLPILESMSHGCPTITFRNSSTPEVGGDAAFYSESPTDTATRLEALAQDPKLVERVRQAGLVQAGRFPWARTANLTLEAMLRKSR